MRRWLLTLIGLAAALTVGPAAAQPPESAYKDWAAIVVAGDWRANDGGATEAFDNARRDVAATLVGLGFRSENLSQFSPRAERYADTQPLRLTAQSMIETLKATASRAKAGCLIYYTSHGAPQGVVLDVRGQPYMFSPTEMAVLVDEACPGRPAIVIISACYSGVFMSQLSGPQRMVMTASRADRSSFGCSSEDKYPNFDACFMESISAVRNFPALAPAIQACVTRLETALRQSPPSEPQVSIDSDLRLRLAMMPFPRDAKAIQKP
ncbi:MAG: C13 family peptidase [Caulobacter sp.]|nr:C13 family peptidase [Caulobacter sp.]